MSVGMGVPFPLTLAFPLVLLLLLSEDVAGVDSRVESTAVVAESVGFVGALVAEVSPLPLSGEAGDSCGPSPFPAS